MYSFVVLGQIPGTEIRISFTGWLLVCLLALACGLAIRRRHHTDLSPLDPTIATDDQSHAATAH